MTIYKEIRFEGRTVAVLRIADNTSIPFDPDNTDYQQYLKWIEEGNTPEPAEEQQ